MRREPSRARPCVAFRMFSSIASSTSRRARTDSVLKTLSSPSCIEGRCIAAGEFRSVGDLEGEMGEFVEF
jgi:hypothetical protein